MNTLDEIKFRAKSPTPPFFQKLKKIGFIVAAIGTAVLAAPAAIPEVLMIWAQHALTAGTVLISVSQLVVDENYPEIKPVS